MNSVFLSLGSNEGDRRLHLERALAILCQLDAVTELAAVSPIYETPALLPPNADSEWLTPFLNMVCKLQLNTAVTALQFLKETQNIELQLGRSKDHLKWSPRIIDIDILFFKGQQISSQALTIPHPEISQRAFVLDPLKDIAPHLQINNQSVLQLARKHKQHAPLWMGIFNMTPDSFSGDHLSVSQTSLEEKLTLACDLGLQIIDFGAESTRPGAQPITPTEELQRLRPALKLFNTVNNDHRTQPLVSIDTRDPEIAKILTREFTIDILNDVEGLRNLKWIDVLKDNSCKYVLMHSLTVPADPTQTLDSHKPVVKELQNWLEQKLEILVQANISTERIIFDPGIGFGKTALQSLELLKNIKEFHKYPVQILVGHSRKSFMNPFCSHSFQDRDLETVGMSLNLVQSGVDIIRVHDFQSHIRSFQAWNHLN